MQIILRPSKTPHLLLYDWQIKENNFCLQLALSLQSTMIGTVFNNHPALPRSRPCLVRTYLHIRSPLYYVRTILAGLLQGCLRDLLYQNRKNPWKLHSTSVLSELVCLSQDLDATEKLEVSSAQIDHCFLMRSRLGGSLYNIRRRWSSHFLA